MKKYNIAAENIEFKNLFSGPAPVGRILNYINVLGNSGLRHKNGNRNTDLKNNIGYAWTTEFMIGLGLVKLGDPIGTAFTLNLTEKGNQLFELMKSKNIKFDEGSARDKLDIVKTQIKNCNPLLLSKLKEIFISSYSFRLLRDYLKENKYYFNQKREFYDDFFYKVGELYDAGTQPENAGYNRLPSLIQLCEIFDYVNAKDGFVFNKELFENNSEVEYVKEELLKDAKKEQKLTDYLESELVEKYGLDGNELVSAIVRNSSLQAKFKKNLMIQQKSKCVICGMENSALLIGSHIKPSSESTVVEKTDYNNGLLLCCNHDKLFDKYLITFDCVTGKIKISKTLSENDRKNTNINNEYFLSEELMSEERKKYLKLHNQIFEKLESKR